MVIITIVDCLVWFGAWLGLGWGLGAKMILIDVSSLELCAEQLHDFIIYRAMCYHDSTAIVCHGGDWDSYNP